MSYTIANLEGSILFILDLEIPEEARKNYDKSAFAIGNPAFTASNRVGQQRSSSISQDIARKYHTEVANELATPSGKDTDIQNINENLHHTIPTIDEGTVLNYSNSSGSIENKASNSVDTEQLSPPAAAVSKLKTDHNEEDVQAMKQLGRLHILHLVCMFYIYYRYIYYMLFCNCIPYILHIYCNILHAACMFCILLYALTLYYRSTLHAYYVYID